MNLIADSIKKSRIKAGMTEKMLAKKCGLAENYIKQIEAGKKVINEQSAQKILKVLGVDADVLQQGAHLSRYDVKLEQSPDTGRKELSRPKEMLDIEPNDQWSDALAHIIRQFPVIDMLTGKTVSVKEIPVLGKKFEGCQWNKIKFFRVADDQLIHLRIKHNDVIMVCESEEVINGKLMVVEMGGGRFIRKIWKDNKTIKMSTGAKNEEPVQYNIDRVNVIGQCIKVEFNL